VPGLGEGLHDAGDPETEPDGRAEGVGDGDPGPGAEGIGGGTWKDWICGGRGGCRWRLSGRMWIYLQSIDKALLIPTAVVLVP